MTPKACQHCIFFRQTGPERTVGETIYPPPGECRRRPPVVIPYFYYRPEIGVSEWSASTHFPEVAGDEWCGEWSPR